MIRFGFVAAFCLSGCATQSESSDCPMARGTYADSCMGCEVSANCLLTCDICALPNNQGGVRPEALDLRTCSEVENNNGALQCCSSSCGAPAPPPLSFVEDCGSPCSTSEPEDLVQVMAGTDTKDGSSNSNGNTMPQVKRPWGFNDWAPQTAGSAGSWWFHRQDTAFEGIRCTHQPSPWISDYGWFRIQPHVVGSAVTLRHSSEEATLRPYLIQERLYDDSSGQEMLFELTPTNHAAIVRVTFPKSAAHKRISIAVDDGEISVNKGAITGYTTSNHGGTPSGWKMHFVVRSVAKSILTSSKQVGTIDFDSQASIVEVTVATSYISVEQADSSLQQEVGSKSFSEILAEGKAEWNEHLSRVQVDARDAIQLRVFYTNLWKAMLFPRYLTETDAFGNEVHLSPYTGKVEPGKLVADSGFWDAYRTVYPLQSIVFPGNMGAFVNGWVNAYKEAGWLPTWPSPGQRGSMVGTMGDVAIADAIVKSQLGFVSGFDVNDAYAMIRKDAYTPRKGLFGRTGLDDYRAKGYVPYEDSDEAVSMTMNDYVADAAIANAALALGYGDDHDDLLARSKRYSVIFNNDSLFFQPKRKDGNWVEGFDPLAWKDGFTESGPWQYRFYVPHDVEGLKELYHGRICEFLDAEMTTTQGPAYHVGGYGRPIHEETELQKMHYEFGYYAHNNQPVHHILWVAKKAGCDAVADTWLRRTMDHLYTMQGWSGDEDNGEMASWYVLSALGVYALEQAKDELVIGSPAVTHASVQLPNGKVFTISTDGQSKDNVHVQSVTWTPTGGSTKPVENNLIKYSDVMNGGEMHFVLSRGCPLSNGSYARSCRDCTVSSSCIISCACDNGHGKWPTSSYNLNDCHTLENDWGKLNCSKSSHPSSTMSPPAVMLV